ncbi:MAG TPA: hypothetical protein VGD69_25410 [Herpetosiphonaceae bacterium]
MSGKRGLLDNQALGDGQGEALGRAISDLRKKRGWTRAVLLDRLYTELSKQGIDYKVKGDWWLSSIENGEKAKQLPREYIDAFILALNCNKLEAVQLMILADLNMLTSTAPTTYAAGLIFVLMQVFRKALTAIEEQIDEVQAAELSEREWLAIGKAVLDVVIADLESQPLAPDIPDR